MTYSLDQISSRTLKAEARVLRETHAAAGRPLSQSKALENVARSHGFRDWNTAVAALPERIGCPVAIGQRVSGRFMKQQFSGVVLGINVLEGAQLFGLKIHFDKPVDVVTFESFSAFRQRIQCRVNVYGASPERTSDGVPHMRLDLSACTGAVR